MEYHSAHTWRERGVQGTHQEARRAAADAGVRDGRMIDLRLTTPADAATACCGLTDAREHRELMSVRSSSAQTPMPGILRCSVVS